MKDWYSEFIQDFPMYQDDEMIRKAFDVAVTAHEGQFRASGEPYISHPYAVAQILASLALDSVSICAGILHDVPEDTDVSIEEVRKTFGEEIARLVDGVTKLVKTFNFNSKEEEQAESFRKLFIAMASDVRVVLIKLADRMHNMRTLEYKTPEKQREKAQETLDIYAPLADRLGISKFKWEFEDLAFKYLNREEYDAIAYKLHSTRSEREDYIQKIVSQIQFHIDNSGLVAEVDGRPKHLYSIYKKMIKKDKTFDELYDLLAVRIIVQTLGDCYHALGTIHSIWRPVPGRLKDYIAGPKSNMYQSLHSTVYGDDGKPFEVQIRTYDMHKTAVYGVAAHWKYKSGDTSSVDPSEKMYWLNDVLEWQQELKDSREFMALLKVDLSSNRLLVVTPKGEVKELIQGSTPLDFAYAIHSEVGNKCIGARVNNKLVPFDHQLKTSDIVDIITSPSSKGPSMDWLKLVKTSQARSKIISWFKKQGREENISKGREMLEKDIKQRGYNYSDVAKPDWLKLAAKRYSISSQDDIFAAIGYGGLSVGQISMKLIDAYRKSQNILEVPKKQHVSNQKHQKDNLLLVNGEKDMLVRLAKCCSPLPGDEIIGYITRGRGVTVHRKDCFNLNDSDFDPDRRIPVAWPQEEDAKYSVEIKVLGEDRPGLIAQVSHVLYTLGYVIQSIQGRQTNNVYVIILSIEVTSMSDLDLVMSKIRGVSSVSDVFRITSNE